VYSEQEFEVMKADVLSCKTLQCDGVVFGILTADEKVDMRRCKILADLAFPMAVSFHRAFDVVPDMFQALEDIISLGFIRILSSGGAVTAVAGAEMLKSLIQKAAGRIEIMPGAGVDAENVGKLIRHTGAVAVHGSFSRDIPYKITETSVVEKVQSILAVI
jgi:copper homeostasis protein